MKARICTRRTIVASCSLGGHAFQNYPHTGYQHGFYSGYALNQAANDWEREVLTNRDITSLVSDELAGPEPESIYMG